MFGDLMVPSIVMLHIPGGYCWSIHLLLNSLVIFYHKNIRTDKMFSEGWEASECSWPFSKGIWRWCICWEFG